MAIDMYLKLDTVDGESIDAGHEKEMHLLSANFGATQTGTAHTGTGSTAGKVSMQDLTITKNVDKATPILFMLLCSGGHIATGVLSVRKAGGDKPLDYMKIKMENVLITAVQHTGANGQEELTEQVSLNFRKVSVEYTTQATAGSGATTVGPKGWDMAANKKWP